jgi:bifunctional N-acetylglucosamine-1-phosphate-uridyltransferase/glucosamine-1-phosphate-acetyltransferase GlmU-like protein
LNYPENKRLTIVVAAAGAGTRMKSFKPKALVQIDNIPLIEITCDKFFMTADEFIVVIQKRQEEYFRKYLSPLYLSKIKFVYQEILSGTLGAISCALPVCRDENLVAVMWADHIGLSNAKLSDFEKFIWSESYDILVPIVKKDNPYTHIEYNERNLIYRFTETRNLNYPIAHGNNDCGIFFLKGNKVRVEIIDYNKRLTSSSTFPEVDTNFLSIFGKLNSIDIVAKELFDETLTLGGNTIEELQFNWAKIKKDL